MCKMRKKVGLKKIGINGKVFGIFLVTLIFVTVAFSIAIAFLFSTLKTVVAESGTLQKNAITTSSEATMDETFTQNMMERTDREAKIAGFMLAELRSKVVFIRTHLLDILERPQLYSTITPYSPDIANEGKISSMLLMSPGVSPDSPEVQAKLAACHDITTTMENVQRDGTGSCFFIGFPEGFAIVSDDNPSSLFFPDGTPLVVDVTERPWYRQALKSDGIFFSDVERDVFTGVREIVCATPIYDKAGKFFCVIGASLSIQNMTEYMGTGATKDSFEVIFNSQGQIVYAPSEQELFNLNSLHSVYDTESENYADFLAFLRYSFDADGTDTMVINIGKKNFYVNSAKIDFAEWVVVSIVDVDLAKRPGRSIIKQVESITEDASGIFINHFIVTGRIVAVVLLFFIVLGGAAASAQARRITLPIKKMAEKLSLLSDGQFHFEFQKLYKTGDEIEILANAFAHLAAEMDKYVREVADNTAEKERIGTELKVATQIQADMLPSIFPAYPERLEFDLFASMTPAREVGGDFYDFFFIDKHHLAMVMADVSGKGVPAALYMVIAKTLIKDRAHMGGSPADILTFVNRQLVKGNNESMFVTVWLAIIDIRTGEGLAANAGHEHPVLRDKSGKFNLVTYKHSLVIGMLEDIHIEEHPFKLEPGDTLFVYTDGVPEANNSKHKQFGTDRMLEVLNSKPTADPKTIIQNMRDGIDKFTGSAEQFDDITMLCFKYNGNSTSTMSTPAKAENLDSVLSFIRKHMDKIPGTNETLMGEIELAVEEVFVNVANYAYADTGEGTGEVKISVQPLTNPTGVIISISDHGKPFNPLKKPDPDITLPAEKREIGGLGIFLVKKTMDNVTYSREDETNILTLCKYF